MIIFDLDSLSNSDHRQHYIDPAKDPNAYFYQGRAGHYWSIKETVKDCACLWSPDYPAYYEACDQDSPVEQVMEIFNKIGEGFAVEIWSERSEEFREKTEKWFSEYFCGFSFVKIKMRAIGDDRPQEELFEEWMLQGCKFDPNHIPPGIKLLPNIDMVFSSHEPTIDMFRKRGIFVFDCNQKIRGV